MGSEDEEEALDVGYGPARVLRAKLVREFAAELERLTEHDLRSADAKFQKIVRGEHPSPISPTRPTIPRQRAAGLGF